jgi:glycosyltransferase involved in cell wall biosynthesis
VVPCFNEEAVIETSARLLLECLRNIVQSGRAHPASRIVFVDDGSSDQTWELIERLCRSESMFSAVGLSRNFGHQSALLAGLFSAPGDALISIDADLQDDLAAIGQMVDRYIEGFEVVYGVRRERKLDSFFKRATALSFYRMMNMLGARTVYNHADFRLMSRRAVEALKEYREINLFLRGTIPLIGLPSSTVYYDRGKRMAGETKYPFRKMLALSISAVTSFSNVPLRMITVIALVGIVLLAGVAVWVVWARLFTDRAIPGWTSIALPMLLASCVNLLAIGVVGEYMARIFDEVKSRPRFLIAETRNLPALPSASAWTTARD